MRNVKMGFALEPYDEKCFHKIMNSKRKYSHYSFSLDKHNVRR